MSAQESFEIFLTAPPGLEPLLLSEAQERGLGPAQAEPGGVALRGGWRQVWRANLELRGADRVLARIASFRAAHLAQLDKRARRIPWAELLRPGTPVKVEVSSVRSRIYHERAAQQRVRAAIEDAIGAAAGADPPTPPIRVLCRIADDLCVVSLDTSGEPLHKRGFKEAVVKAPLRETLAALLLRACGFDPAEPLIDPMCGSGSLPLEAAEWAAGLAPGRARAFDFERLVGFDQGAWRALRAAAAPETSAPAKASPSLQLILGRDRDAGAIAASQANARRAGVAARLRFETGPVSALARPDGPAGLVIANPPYGRRIGEPAKLRALYASFGQLLRRDFAGWRVGLITSETALARATGLPFGPPGPPIPHGGAKIRLFQTDPLR